MAIFTFSRQSGSGGTQLARDLAERLQVPFLDKEALESFLIKHGISGPKIEQYDEKKPSIWEKLSEEKDRYLHWLKVAVCEFARAGQGVILGRGTQVILAEIPGVYHIRVIAPHPARRKRIQEKYSCDAMRAEQIMRQSDHDRAGFHRFFFHVNWDDPGLYDLIVNTGGLRPEMALALLQEAAHREDEDPRVRERDRLLADLCLRHQVEARILCEERILVNYLDVQVNGGIVTLNGNLGELADIGRCRDAAARIDGVQGVISNLTHSGQPHHRI